MRWKCKTASASVSDMAQDKLITLELLESLTYVFVFLGSCFAPD